MESTKPIKIEELTNLIGEITDYISELSENEELDDVEVEAGEFTEKYFNEKLKYLFKSNLSFSNTIEISQVSDELILSINYAMINNPNIQENSVREIINIIKKYLKNETSIQIDSFLPMVEGKQINKLFENIEDYSYPSINKVDDEKKYSIVVESTFSLKSQIIKKTKQLTKTYMLFSLIHQLYKKYPKYIENYYKYFIRKYILREKVEKRKFEYEDNEIDLSCYGNYIFIIATNKSFKSFKESELITNTFSFKDEEVDYSLRKCFEFDNKKSEKKNTSDKTKILSSKNENKNNINNVYPSSNDDDINKEIKSKNDHSSIIPKVVKKYKNDINNEVVINKVSKNPFLLNSYKVLNYLLKNINKSNNCRAKVIYLDTYLNLTSPKCVILEKMEDISTELVKVNQQLDNIIKENSRQKKINKILIDIITKNCPEYNNLSQLLEV